MLSAMGVAVPNLTNPGRVAAPTASLSLTTTTLVASSANPTYGQNETLTATVSSQAGSPNAGAVTFFDGSTSLATVPISSGTAQFSTTTLTVGLHVFSATYSGDGATFAGSSSSSVLSPSSIIQTVAGNGVAGYKGDGMAATLAELNGPYGEAFDSAGNLYIDDDSNNVIRKVDAQTHVITTVAGTGVAGFNGNGIPATSAELDIPRAIAVDAAGNLFIADDGNHRVREVSAATGLISTVAGAGVTGYNGDGIPATSAHLDTVSIALDSAGNLYIADALDDRVREVNAATGLISTIAGNGTEGYNGDGIAATSAELDTPDAVTLDAAGDVFISDSSNHLVREVNASTRLISTVAGTRTAGYNGDGIAATSANLNFPEGLAIDGSGNLYISDRQDQRVREVNAATGLISTIAGTGAFGYNGDNIPAGSAEISTPVGLAIDSAGNLYFSDVGNNRIRDVSGGVLVDVAPFVVNPGAPSIVAPATATVSENGSLAFSAANGNPVSFTDNGAGVNSDLLTLAVSHGTLTLGNTTGLTLTAGGNGSASLTVKGTVSNLNNAISGLTYTPTANYAGSDSISIIVSDPGDSLSGSASVAITVSPLPPSIAAPTSASLSQNGSFGFSGGNTVSVTDANVAVDSLSLSVTHGTLTLSTISGLTFPSGSNGTATFTVSGTVASLNAALSGLAYAPTTNYVGSDSLALSILDPGDGLSASKNVSLTVNSLPAPTIGAPASATMLQNSSLVFSPANGNAISLADSAAGSNSDSLTLSVTHGTLTLSTTSGLTFTTGTNGSASFTATGTISSLNAALSGLTYQPTAGYTGSDSLAISLADTVDGLSASKNVALTVSNSPPAITAPSTATVIAPLALVFAPSKGNGISIADVNAGTTVQPLTLTATNGILTLGSTTGITITAGANGSAFMTIGGTLAALNNALSGLTFKPAQSGGNATVVLSYTDVATGQLASATINISVQRLVFKPGQVTASSSPSSAAAIRRTPSGAGTLASAVNLSSTIDSDSENFPPPDVLTQWQGLKAAVDLLNA